MTIEIKVPVLPESVADATIVTWHKKTGDSVKRDENLVDIETDKVVLEVPYAFHQRILETPKSRDLLESVLGDVLNKPTKVSCVLGSRPVRVEEIANVEVAADDEIIRVAAEIFNSETPS